MKKTRNIVIVIILILLIVSGFVYAYIKTDILKSPKQLFAKYLIKNVVEISNFNIEPYDDIWDELSEKSAKTMIDYNNKDINIEYKGYMDLKNDNLQGDIKVVSDNEQIFDMSIATSENALGILISDLYDNYIVIENRDLDNITKEIGILPGIQVPSQIPEIDFSKNEKENKLPIRLTLKYLKLFSDRFDEGWFTQEEVAVKNVNNEEVISSKYSLDIVSDDFYTIVLECFKELLADEEFLKLYSEEIGIDKINELSESCDELLKEIKNNPSDKKILINIYEYQKEILKAEIIEYNEAQNINYSFCVANSENESVMKIEEMVKTDLIQDSKTITIKNSFENGNGIFTFENENLNNENTKVEIYTKQKDDSNVEIDIKSNDNSSIKVYITFIDTFEKVELTKSNSIIINDYTLRDYQNLGAKMIQNALTTIITNPDSLIGSIAKEYLQIDTSFFSEPEYNTFEGFSIFGNDATELEKQTEPVTF